MSVYDLIMRIFQFELQSFQFDVFLYRHSIHFYAITACSTKKLKAVLMDYMKRITKCWGRDKHNYSYYLVLLNPV